MVKPLKAGHAKGVAINSGTNTDAFVEIVTLFGSDEKEAAKNYLIEKRGYGKDSGILENAMRAFRNYWSKYDSAQI